MSNMSYCRFQNTASDLRDCLENFEFDDLSEKEARARKRIIRMCIEIAHDYENEVTVPATLSSSEPALSGEGHDDD